MAKGRKARRNTVARVAETGQRPAAAYREMRAANAPYEGYVVELHHVVDAYTQDGHVGDFWGYRVSAPDGTELDWYAVVAGDEAAGKRLTARQRYMIAGGLPVDAEALRVRFPGARVRQFTTMPEVCHHRLVSCWDVHRGCTVSCERLAKQGDLEARRDAEESYHAAEQVSQERYGAMLARHDQEDAELAQAKAELAGRFEVYSELVQAGRWEQLGVDGMSMEALSAADDALRVRGDAQRAAHLREYERWRAEQPVLPEHWRTPVTA